MKMLGAPTRLLISLLVTALTLCYADVSLADITSLKDENTSNNDLSIYYLGLIFGTVGNVLYGTGGQVFGDIFRIFNTVILTLGTIVGAYTIVMGAVNTAQEGQVMGQKWSSVWIPMKSAIGLSLLVPTSTGYSILQVGVMWVVLQGVYGANQVWGALLDAAQLGVSITGQPKLNSKGEEVDEKEANGTTVEMIQNLVKGLMCQHAYQKAAAAGADFPFNANSIAPYVYTSNTTVTKNITQGKMGAYSTTTVTVPDNMTVRIGIQGDPAHQAICGESTAIHPSVISSTAFAQRQVSAVLSVADKLDDVAQTIIFDKPQLAGNPAPCVGFDIKCFLARALPLYLGANAYYITDAHMIYDGQVAMNKMYDFKKGVGDEPLVDPSMLSAANPNDVYEVARKNGWITTGSYYYKLVHPPTPDGVKDAPAASFAVGDGDANVLAVANNAIQMATLKAGGSQAELDKAKAELKPLNPADPVNMFQLYQTSVALLGEQRSESLSLGKVQFKGASAKIMAGLSKPMMGIAKKIISRMTDSGDPMVSMARLGSDIMARVEITWISLTLITLALMIPAATASFSNPMGFALDTIITLISGISSLMLSTLWAFSATLAIYVPLIPYMVFLMGSISWLMSVIEAMVAAPLVALGITAPSAEHLGRAAPSVMLITSVFLRPTLMVIGFLAGARVLSICFAILKFGFMETVMSMMGGLGLFGPVAIIALFSTTAVALTNKSFSLIHIIPDRVLRWVGGQAEQWGQSDQQDLQQGKAKFEGAAAASAKTGSAISSGAGQLTTGVRQQKTQHTEAKAEKAEKEKEKSEAASKEKATASRLDALEKGSGGGGGGSGSGGGGGGGGGSGGGTN